MTETELLSAVKTGLGITGQYQDETLKIFIYEVLEYLRSAGVSDSVLTTESIVGVVVRGVSDLWNYGAANGTLSDYFIQRAIQLKYEVEEA